MKMEVTISEIAEIFKEIQERPGQLFDMIRLDIREVVGKYLTAMMNAELTHYLGREPYVCVSGHVNHRNGSYGRGFALKGIGEMHVDIPRDRDGEFKTFIIPRSKQYEEEIARDFSILFLAGVKTYGYKPDSTWTTDPVFMQQNGNYYFYHNDHLGTPQKMMDTGGAVVWSATYDAFGKATVDGSSTITGNLRFPGQYYDQETGLHYNRNRYYDPDVGMFISSDPIGFWGNDINLYRYVWSNPLNWFDFDGLAGDGQKAWRKEWSDWYKSLLEYSKCTGESCFLPPSPSVTLPAKGHSDFYGNERFDYTKEDYGSSAPIPIIGDPERHFQNWQKSYVDVLIAIQKCNRDEFERSMHRLQDFYFHYGKGYRWNPLKGYYGHAPDTTLFKINPDDDPVAWERANIRTKKMVEEWDQKCCKK